MINAHFDEIRSKLDRLNALSDSINSLERQFDEANGIFRETLKCSTDRLSTIARTLGTKSIKHGRVYHAAKLTVEQNQSECQRACVQFEQANKEHQSAKKAILEAEQKLKEATSNNISDTPACENGHSSKSVGLEKLRINDDDDDDEQDNHLDTGSSHLGDENDQTKNCDEHNPSTSNPADSLKSPSKISSSPLPPKPSSPFLLNNNQSSIESKHQATHQISEIQLNNNDTTTDGYSSSSSSNQIGDDQNNAHNSGSPKQDRQQQHHNGYDTRRDDAQDSHHHADSRVGTSSATTDQIVSKAAKLSDQLNQAIMRLDEAERRREQSEKQHLDCANKLMVSKENLVRLEREHGQSIRRSQLYFDEAKQFNAKLDSVKSNICRISRDILAAKRAYAQTLSELEQFSEDLHENSAQLAAKEENEKVELNGEVE